MPDRFPGYDVLRKRDGLSWNDKTREVIGERLALPDEPRFFTADEFATVTAIAARIVPRPVQLPPIPVAALVDHKLHVGQTDGYRQEGMPREQEAWRTGLRALDAEARRAFGARFAGLTSAQQDELIGRMQAGTLHGAEWEGMPPKTFFTERLARDIVLAYYAHPTAWSEIGWGGPASPRLRAHGL
jgi:hypothetical protein